MGQSEIEDLGRTYYQSFKAFKDHEIEQAADDYMNSGEYFPPKPSQIISLVKSGDNSRHDRELVERWTCSLCKMKTSSITSEGVCLDCAGVPAPIYKHIKPLEDPIREHYTMEGRIRCQKCGYVGLGINDPSVSSQWLCRSCYSGKSREEIVTAWKELGALLTHEKSM